MSTMKIFGPPVSGNDLPPIPPIVPIALLAISAILILALIIFY